jgi:iron complex outermembrane receptor protein
VPALGKRGEVFVALENLFDQQYEFRAGYPMPRRSAQVGLHASF